MTKSQAAAYYTRIVAPINTEITRMNGLANASLATVQAEAARAVTVYRRFTDALLAVQWPANAQPVVNELVADLSAQTVDLTQLAKAQTLADASQMLEKFANEPGSDKAQLLRTLLGLGNVGG